MARQEIQQTDSGSQAANKINSNFTELYARPSSGGSGVPDWDLVSGMAYDNAIKQMVSPSSGIYMASSSVNILHFSDIHADDVNLARAIAFGTRYSNFIDDIIHTGDSVRENWDNGFSFWTNCGADDVLNCIGNHDPKYGGSWFGKTAAECAERYITPFAEDWGVTIGTGVCYYYKDYVKTVSNTTTKVRLIVLDAMHWDSTQETWLTDTLDAAKSGGYHVIIASHFAPAKSDWIECNFDTWHYNYDHTAASSYRGYLDVYGIPAIVDAFMTGGGKFICYLAGHTHVDECRFCDGYPNQLFFCVNTAGHTMPSIISTYDRRVVGERSQDCMNLYSIRPTEGVLAVLRIGNDFDRAGKHKGGMTYDYFNHKIIGQW